MNKLQTMAKTDRQQRWWEDPCGKENRWMEKVNRHQRWMGVQRV